MKTMRAKIIGLILGLTIASCGTLGVMSVFLNMSADGRIQRNGLRACVEGWRAEYGGCGSRIF